MSAIGLIEMLLSFSLPIGWAIWELVKLKRERAKDAEIAAHDKREPD